MPIIIPELTQEQIIAKQYSACLDSVNLINAGKPTGMSDEEWLDCVECNKEHLRIMLAKDFWTTEDLSPIQAVLE